jgi:hypothetical protein
MAFLILSGTHEGFSLRTRRSLRLKTSKEFTAEIAEFAEKSWALKYKPSFPGIGKEAQEVLDKFAHPESHVPRTFRVESWHLAAAIDDPGPVAVAS